MYDGLAAAAASVPDFTMVVNSMENGDNIVASSDYLKNKEKILDTGVRLYEFDGGDSSHGKSLLIDGDLSVVGSYNLDLRSTYMDTELMLAVHSPQLNRQLAEYMDSFQEKSRRVLGPDAYDTPEGLAIRPVPFHKKLLLWFLGVVLVPVRYVI